MKEFSLLVFVLVIFTAKNAYAVSFPAPSAGNAPDQGNGWYFREYEISLGRQPGPLLSQEDTSVPQSSGSDTSTLLIGRLSTINVICPRGYVSSGCIGGTVPPGIGNIQWNGGVSQELNNNLLSVRPGSVSSGFNIFTGCGVTVRFDFPIPSSYLRQSSSVFVKVEAYCRRPQGTPTPVVPVPSPIPVNPIPIFPPIPVTPVPSPIPVNPIPIFPPIPVTPVVPPTPVVPIDPCICGDNALPFGCQSTSLCPTFLICYARVPCTGFQPSRLRPGEYFKCVTPSQCRPSPPIPPPRPDPCSCRNRFPPLGCSSTTACATGVVCYVDENCPGFSASQNPDRVGQFFQCVNPNVCR